MAFQLSSPAFANGEPIPPRYTADGEDFSPPLEWTGPPASTRSFALIVDDPDAPMTTWVHWVVFNLPAETRSLPEARRLAEDYLPGTRLGRNGWGRQSYGGPSPPWGTHRYYFKLYALDATLDLAEGARKSDLSQAMEGHVLGQTELIGSYKRSKSLLERIRGIFLSRRG